MHKLGLVSFVVFAVLLSFGFAQLALADDSQPTPLQNYWTNNYSTFSFPTTAAFDWSVVAKAKPDECFFALGDPNNSASFYANYPTGLSTGYARPCSFGAETNGIPKVNQAYLWGLTKQGNNLWFGTIGNTLCLVMEAMGLQQPLQENTLVCEGTTAQGVPKDQRTPRIFMYNTVTNTLTDMSPLVKADSTAFGRLQTTIGLRSAGSLNNIVILGGIGFGGVTMFAFDGSVNPPKFLGSQVFPTYSNIRQWIVVNNNLYVGVATGQPTGLFSTGSGAILHWIGDVNHPFNFETVGTVPGDPAYLTTLGNRMYVSTWGGPDGSNGTIDSFGTVVCMSPTFTTVLPSSTAAWTTVWRLSDYEVERSAGMAGGAIMGFDGWLYFTTMLPPGAQLLQFQNNYPTAPTDTTSLAADFLGSYRPTAMFRGKNFGTPNQTIELLYGNALLPKYDSPSNTWSLVRNNLHQSPKWGLAGYNNFFNSYTWWMYVYNKQLFIGTFDWSYLLFEALFDQYGSQIPPAVINTARSFEGADLLMLNSSYDSPVAVSLDGMGNFSNYGVRTMIDLNGALYLGTANPFNLLTDTTTTQYDGKLGGWELIRLTPHVKLNTTSAVTGPSTKFFSSGQPVTLKATVTSSSGTATGTVKFLTSTTMGFTLGTAPLNSMGVATLTTVLPNGNNYIHVEYSGDANYNPSSSPTLLLWMY